MKRRAMIAGLAAAMVAAAGTAAWKLHLFGPRYAPTPYDDLLNQIVDRGPAYTLGQAVLKTMPDFDAAKVAQMLRHEEGLSTRAAADAQHNRVVEAGGWIVPESAALYSALAMWTRPKAV